MERERKSGTIPHFNIGKVEVNSWKMQYPLAVDGCLIMLCERGHIEITVNSSRCVMHSGNMAFIVFDMVAVPVGMSDDFSAKYITMDFDATQDIFFLVTSNRLWEYLYASPVFALSRELTGMASRWFCLMEWLAANCLGGTAEKVLRNEMENFMLVMAGYVESHYGVLGTNPTKNRAWVLVNEFMGLLNRYYAHHHEVAFYAGKLNITPNYLNIIAKRILGITAKEQINVQLGLVVKMLLDTTDLTVKEIAERVHYDDPSYLCRIFRKQTGLSPIQYRNKHRRSKEDHDGECEAPCFGDGL